MDMNELRKKYKSDKKKGFPNYYEIPVNELYRSAAIDIGILNRYSKTCSFYERFEIEALIKRIEKKREWYYRHKMFDVSKAG